MRLVNVMMRIRTGFRGRSCVLAACLALVNACSLVLDPDRVQCSSAEQCSEAATGVANLTCNDGICSEIAEAGPWDCVGTPAPEKQVGDEVDQAFQITSLLSAEPLEGATVRACRALDTECKTPVVDWITTGADGIAAFKVSKDFVGFLEIEAEGLMPELLAVNVPQQTSPTEGSGSTGDVAVIQMLSELEYGFLTDQAGQTIDPELGQLSVRVVDCKAQLAAGVTYKVDTSDRKTTQYYLSDGVPSASATETDAAGQAGFINTPLGFLTVTGYVAGIGSIGSVSLVSRAGWLSLGAIIPDRT